MTTTFIYQDRFFNPALITGPTPTPVGSAGTRITFNKNFKSVQSVVLTPQTTQKVFAIYNNLTVTGCNVFVYDTNGNRITCPVTWIARGILSN